jgi:pyruvate/2-oxoglutarate dehydrogenase complex dihydrolipoamide dehydrogenase (E3) component
MSFDLAVIGGGPAGVSAVLRARELGATAALVEGSRLGGTCTNDGCVPTRVLAHAARLVRDAEQFRGYGLTGGSPTVDFPAVLARARDVVEAVHAKKQLERHLTEAGVQRIAGAARFTDPHTLETGSGETVRASSFVVCVGGHPRRLAFPGAELALTHSDVWSLRELPRSLAIVGAAATGCQLASIFAAFGTSVTLLELAPRALPNEDAAVSSAVTAALLARGIAIHTGIDGVDSIERGAADGPLTVRYRDGGAPATLDAEQVLLAVGWPGNVDGLGLDAAGVTTERGYVVVDERLRTSVPHILAAGDITGRMMLVQSATFEARIAAENAVGGGTLDASHGIVPHGGFTDPEYGSVGLTEVPAREQGAVAVAQVPYRDLDRAVIDGRTEGFCKLIVSRESRHVLGAHVVGEQAVEVVQLVAAGMAAGARAEDLAQLELAYPTFTAIVGLAARQLVRELGVVPLAPAWRALAHPRAGEWEQSES